MPRRSRIEPSRNPRGLGVNCPQESAEEFVEERSPRPRASSEGREPRRSEDNQRRRSQSVPRGALAEIHHLQNSVGLLIPKLPFGRVIREALLKHNKHDFRITASCLSAIQEAAEIFMVQLYEDADLCCHHRQRATLLVKDIRLALALRRPL